MMANCKQPYYYPVYTMRGGHSTVRLSWPKGMDDWNRIRWDHIECVCGEDLVRGDRNLITGVDCYFGFCQGPFFALNGEP